METKKLVMIDMMKNLSLKYLPSISLCMFHFPPHALILTGQIFVFVNEYSPNSLNEKSLQMQDALSDDSTVDLHI